MHFPITEPGPVSHPRQSFFEESVGYPDEEETTIM
tara:strand:+ start:2422 stop:2526 length:105 start_codon:yes stop_codon:yes gene_type:complete